MSLVTELTFAVMLTFIAGIVLGCHDAERLALFNFKQSVSDPSNGTFSSWKGVDCCHWYGVFCDNVTGYVYTLDLSKANEQLTAQMLDPLIVLRHLEYLDLSYNNFQGSQIPGFIGSFKHLRYLKASNSNFSGVFPLLSNSTWSSRIETLDLSDNLLAGSLPNIFANMTSLVHLDLSRNFFSGSIPLGLRNCRKIDYIDLSSNSFRGVEGGIIMEIFDSPSLTHLDLSSNILGGILADPHGNFSKTVTHGLEYLDLSDNKISGSLPVWLGVFKMLGSFDIESNTISGHIPASIGNLSSLEYLGLSDNSLDGPIPENLRQLHNLQIIDLSHNRLEGVVSSSHLANLSNLVDLDFSHNPIKLTFRTDWIPSFQLDHLDLSSCSIGAQLPRWIQSHTSLGGLYLSNTDISGELPPSLCKLYALGFIDFGRNSLSGTIPDCWRSKAMTLINLSSNNLSGAIPASIGLLSSLLVLYLNNNSLEGSIPPNFGLLNKLIFIDLGENMLSGGIPDWRSKSHPYLKIVRLRSNKLTGVIPKHLCSLPSVKILDLANNNLTGTIPECLGHLSGMQYGGTIPLHFNLSNVYPFGGETTEVLKGEELSYTTNLDLLVNLDLSSNRLVGSIPEGITNLSGLIGLNFSNNSLTGVIPEKIGEMKSLESLDLSNNHLSGTVPPSLSQLTFLSGLNLSNNDLQGQIPTGNQLQVLTDPLKVYGGNPGLCGDTLPNKCKSNHAQQRQQEQERDKEGGTEKALLYFVIFSGFATGFWGVVGSLLLNQRFRFALFQLVSNIADYFYVHVMIRVNRLRDD